jgi:cytochrome c oxidase assembly protein subunit 15
MSVTENPVTSPWPRRVALALLTASIPLILFGGTVTTLRAGMAEDGWLRPDGYLLWLYPLELRLRSAGVFVEHHHREIGSLVGLIAIALVVVTWLGDRRRSARWLSVATLLGICVQGAIGGFRVLEANPDLAFLHGALAHAVFALIGANVVLASRGWRQATPAEHPASGVEGLARLAVLVAVAVYGQIVVGAWLRHSGEPAALLGHIVLAVVAVAAVLAIANRLARTELAPLVTAAQRLRQLVGLQVLLGLGSAVGVYGFSGGFEGEVSGFELLFATLHVLFGALLLLQTVGAAMWAGHVLPTPRARAELAPSLGGAR